MPGSVGGPVLPVNDAWCGAGVEATVWFIPGLGGLLVIVAGSLRLRAFGVQGEEAGEDFVAGGVGPAVALGLLAVAPFFLVDRVVEEEFAVGGDVAPAVGGEDGAVHGGVQGAELGDVRIGFVGIVEAVVGSGHAFVVSDHEGGAEVVVRLAGGFEGGVGFPTLGEGEGLEAVGGGVASRSSRDEPKKRAQISWGRDWRAQKAACVVNGKMIVVCA